MLSAACACGGGVSAACGGKGSAAGGGGGGLFWCFLGETADVDGPLFWLLFSLTADWFVISGSFSQNGADFCGCWDGT